MRLLDCEQGSPEWFEARRGIPTASKFKTIIGVRKDARDKVTRRTYMAKLAAERITGEPTEEYSNLHMERGKLMEDEARSLYAFLNDVEPQQVGFVVADDGSTGCSPDALIGNDGMLEIKTALPHIVVGYIDKGDFPPEHKAQTQGGLWIAEREWIDLAIYWPKMPPFIKRAHRDEAYIAELAQAVALFNEELDELTERIRRYGEPSTLKADLKQSVLMAG